MNNFKKIGLTALAASLVATSAFAGTLEVSGDASIKSAHVSEATGANTGKAFSMGNSVTFTGGGELDNGLNVSVSFELDQGEADGTQTSGQLTADGAVFDSHSVTVSSDALGSLTFAGHGGDSAQSAVKDTTGKIWDIQGTTSQSVASSSSNNMMLYTLPSLIDGLTVKASYVPKGAVATRYESAMDYSLAYSGVEGLVVGAAFGEDTDTKGEEADVDTLYANYTYGPVKVAYTQTERDEATAANDREHTAMSISYTVSENISVMYAESTVETGDTSDKDEEVSGITASYTMGGMTISGAMIDIDNQGFAADTKSEAWELALAFAF